MNDTKKIALAGNPNVGKSTIFNALTGMKQHTGNWTGKTVDTAIGYCKSTNYNLQIVDIPGTYSLLAHSPEEEVARNFICFEKPDAVVVVCDATCLERNLTLVLQTMEICDNVIVCVNLLDEAKRKGITIDLKLLSQKLGVAVVGTSARKKQSILRLLDTIDTALTIGINAKKFAVEYSPIIKNALNIIIPVISPKVRGKLSDKWLALKLLENNQTLLNEVSEFLGFDISKDAAIEFAVNKATAYLEKNGITPNELEDLTATATILSAEKIIENVITYSRENYKNFDFKIDKIVTSKLFAYPIMLCMLILIFWLTISGANYPSDLLFKIFFRIEDKLSALLLLLKTPTFLHDMLLFGVYRTVAWIVSVMLPPMAIFFPLFTLLEDLGFLPRISYNLDKPFKKCNACGKQALTMCMGFGCNAVGVTGCRIIDSPRERLLAVLTNSLVPCNGRFPAIITIITIFFVTQSGFSGSVLAAVCLTAVIIFSIMLTFFVTKLLSVTFLKGAASSYILEMPPYRKPQVLKVVVRSIFDRTLFVLGRALMVAAPAGLIIFLMSNIFIKDKSLLLYCSDFLNPFAQLMGLDGIILMAFVLGFPANEIVIPIIIMAYTNAGVLNDNFTLSQIHELFILNGWNFQTALSFIIFSLCHWPCSTTVLTIKKETGSRKWTALSFIIPTLLGIILCIALNLIINLF